MGRTLTIALIGAAHGQTPSPDERAREIEAQIDGIARALLAHLSLDEKISMMSGVSPFFQGLFHINSGDYSSHPFEIFETGWPVGSAGGRAGLTPAQPAEAHHWSYLLPAPL